VGFFRREKPLHERLAEEGGLELERDPREPVGGLLPPLDPSPNHPFWRIAGIHGIPRVREWDAVASTVAPGLPGDRTEFVAIEDGTLFTDDDLPDDSLVPLADALEGRVKAPYHALAVRQEEDVWSVAAMRVSVVEVPEDIPGDTVEMAINEDGRTIRVDDDEFRGRIQSLEDYAAEQFGSFVMRASRLDDTLWEVAVFPL
jgi:hypothetical protein